MFVLVTLGHDALVRLGRLVSAGGESLEGRAFVSGAHFVVASRLAHFDSSVPFTLALLVERAFRHLCAQVLLAMLPARVVPVTAVLGAFVTVLCSEFQHRDDVLLVPRYLPATGKINVHVHA